MATTVDADNTITVGYHPQTAAFSVECRPGGPLRMGLNRAGAVTLAARLGATPDQAARLVALARNKPAPSGLDRYASITLCPICDRPTVGHDHTDCEF